VWVFCGGHGVSLDSIFFCLRFFEFWVLLLCSGNGLSLDLTVLWLRKCDLRCDCSVIEMGGVKCLTVLYWKWNDFIFDYSILEMNVLFTSSMHMFIICLNVVIYLLCQNCSILMQLISISSYLLKIKFLWLDEVINISHCTKLLTNLKIENVFREESFKSSL